MGAVALFLTLPGGAALVTAGTAAATPDARKQPMAFTWHEARTDACEPNCGPWIAAVGIITSDTPALFDSFIAGRNVKGATAVLDSSGGSVLDAIALGRRWRDLGLRTMVGRVIAAEDSGRRSLAPEAYCESMCVFLLLSGHQRHVPVGAHVRVHQIWMGDRADDAKAASYTAQDMTIVERDIGRLAKYTFDMGGSGELLSLALSVPPWEPLHELSPAELRLTNLVTPEAIADSDIKGDRAAGRLAGKPIQDRFAGGTPAATLARDEAQAAPKSSTKTAEAHAPTGGAASAAPERP